MFNFSSYFKTSDSKPSDPSYSYSQNLNEFEPSPPPKTDCGTVVSDTVTLVPKNPMNKRFQKLFDYGLGISSKSKTMFASFASLMTRDSFKLLRISIYIFLIIFSLLFFLAAFWQNDDVYEKMFNYFINNVEIKNPSFAGRSF